MLKVLFKPGKCWFVTLTTKMFQNLLKFINCWVFKALQSIETQTWLLLGQVPQACFLIFKRVPLRFSLGGFQGENGMPNQVCFSEHFWPL